MTQENFTPDSVTHEVQHELGKFVKRIRRQPYTLQDFADYLQGRDSTFLSYVRDGIYEPILSQIVDTRLRAALMKTRRIRVSKVIGSSRHTRGKCPVTGLSRPLCERIFIQDSFHATCSREGGRLVRAITQLRSFLLQHRNAHKRLDDSTFETIHEQFLYLRSLLYIDSSV